MHAKAEAAGATYSFKAKQDAPAPLHGSELRCCVCPSDPYEGMLPMKGRLLRCCLRCTSTPSSFCTWAQTAQTHPQLHPADARLKAFCGRGRLREALLEMGLLGKRMKCKGYDLLLTECMNRGAVRVGRRVHGHMIKARYFPPVYLANRIIVMYVKCGEVSDALKMLEGMSERTVVSWTAVIAGCCQSGYGDVAFELFINMMREGTLPNEFTLASILTACNGPSGLEKGRQIHSLLLKSNLECHVFVGSSLLDMYAKSGEIHEARSIFDGLPERDVVSFTAIISGCAQQGYDKEAVELFRQYHEEGMETNCVTFASLLTALSSLSALEYGRQVHGWIIRHELPFYVVMQNSLIDMYCKCGYLNYSRRVFENMHVRTVISWNALLVGYGKHGLGKEVLGLFRSMVDEKVKPDNVTFMAILSACSHRGLVDEGVDIFNNMLTCYNVEPEVQHYGCIVDLFGRAGRLVEALEFIKQMPFQPTSAIWASLLGACRVHSNVYIGEYVARKLFEMEPQNSGNYVNLSNIYAAAGRWEDVLQARKMMEEKTVSKEPGRSWIELDKTLHTFQAGGHSHPRKTEIYTKLEELSGKIKEAGYVPDLSCVLHDVDDEQKERMLLSHSEKLAIAFGLIVTPQTKAIRVVKNLRICVDCHSFAKFVSRVCQREIILRDNNRFHRIVGGDCSCVDYW
ncbi:hypothetical protein Taro_022967 [Colocasia esculenta]|uniref:DYW domain-containing protein n=1 Tax=Colocasia esculenta TaxID=4460 RepID=A0A843V6X7_COLES|nr:hypothetical protein [Colocasia esculenta]